MVTWYSGARLVPGTYGDVYCLPDAVDLAGLYSIFILEV